MERLSNPMEIPEELCLPLATIAAAGIYMNLETCPCPDPQCGVSLALTYPEGWSNGDRLKFRVWLEPVALKLFDWLKTPEAERECLEEKRAICNLVGRVEKRAWN